MSLVFYGFSALVLCLIFVYAVGFSKSRSVSHRLEKQGGSPLLSVKTMDFGYWMFEPVVRGLADLGIHPHVISLLCGAGTVFFCIYAVGVDLIWGGIGFLLSSALDSLDGMLARLIGKAGDDGEVLDAVIDRLCEIVFFTSVLYLLRDHLGLYILTVSSLVGAVLTSYTQAKSDIYSISIPKGMMRRPERVLLQFFSLFLSGVFQKASLEVPILGWSLFLVVWWCSLSLMTFSTWINVIHRVYVLMKTLSHRKEGLQETVS